MSAGDSSGSGGALAAGGANALNMVVDRDIDRLMERTKGRPLVTGAMTPRAALLFALALEVGAFVELATVVNLLSAVLAVSAVYIALNETFANWQAIWLCAGFLGLAVILARARDAPD